MSQEEHCLLKACPKFCSKGLRQNTSPPEIPSDSEPSTALLDEAHQICKMEGLQERNPVTAQPIHHSHLITEKIDAAGSRAGSWQHPQSAQERACWWPKRHYKHILILKTDSRHHSCDCFLVVLRALASSICYPVEACLSPQATAQCQKLELVVSSLQHFQRAVGRRGRSPVC